MAALKSCSADCAERAALPGSDGAAGAGAGRREGVDAAGGVTDARGDAGGAPGGFAAARGGITGTV